MKTVKRILICMGIYSWICTGVALIGIFGFIGVLASALLWVVPIMVYLDRKGWI